MSCDYEAVAGCGERLENSVEEKDEKARKERKKEPINSL